MGREVEIEMGLFTKKKLVLVMKYNPVGDKYIEIGNIVG